MLGLVAQTFGGGLPYFERGACGYYKRFPRLVKRDERHVVGQWGATRFDKSRRCGGLARAWRTRNYHRLLAYLHRAGVQQKIAFL